MDARKLPDPTQLHADWLVAIMHEAPFSLRHYRAVGLSIDRRHGRIWTIEAGQRLYRALIDGVFLVHLMDFADEDRVWKINHFQMSDKARQFWTTQLTAGLTAEQVLSAWLEQRKSSAQEDEKE